MNAAPRRAPLLLALLALAAGARVAGEAVVPAAFGESAAADGAGDLRGLSLGLLAAQLPGGFTGFRCAADPSQALAGFTSYAACPKGAGGWHGVAFRFDPAASPRAALNPEWGATRLAGHPVRLEAGFDDAGRLVALSAVTDPAAPPPFRRRAYLFAEQAMAHFGAAGWRCTDTPPGPGESPVGGLFLHRSCVKTTPTRRYLVEARLYHREAAGEGGGAGEAAREGQGLRLVNEASLLITLP